VVSLNFSEFHIEGGPTNCFDWLAVYDGPDMGSSLLGRYCGSRLPGENGTITTTRNSVFLAFRSDHSVGEYYSKFFFTQIFNYIMDMEGKY
jgi:hypothetical protein